MIICSICCHKLLEINVATIPLWWSVFVVGERNQDSLCETKLFIFTATKYPPAPPGRRAHGDTKPKFTVCPLTVYSVDSANIEPQASSNVRVPDAPSTQRSDIDLLEYWLRCSWAPHKKKWGREPDTSFNHPFSPRHERLSARHWSVWMILYFSKSVQIWALKVNLGSGGRFYFYFL